MDSSSFFGFRFKPVLGVPMRIGDNGLRFTDYEERGRGDTSTSTRSRDGDGRERREVRCERYWIRTAKTEN
jgi:hypothetical protein